MPVIIPLNQRMTSLRGFVAFVSLNIYQNIQDQEEKVRIIRERLWQGGKKKQNPANILEDEINQI